MGSEMCIRDSPEPPCLVGSPAEGQLREFLASYSHRDWARDQDQEPLCRATMKYLRLNCPTPFPAEVLTPVGTLPAPSASDVLELARKSAIFTTDEDVPLLVRRPKPHSGPTATATPTTTLSHTNDDAPIRIYVPILMRPWVMKGLSLIHI